MCTCELCVVDICCELMKLVVAIGGRILGREGSYVSCMTRAVALGTLPRHQIAVECYHSLS